MKINVRSPYYIHITGVNLTNATINLYIYSGTQVATMDAITYSLTSTAYLNKVTFEISELVRDYLDVLYNGTYTSQAVFVNYQVTKSNNYIAQTPEPVVQLTALDGYGYFQDGAQNQGTALNGNRLLQTNTTVSVLGSSYFYIPIQQDELAQVDLKINGSIVDTQVFTPTTSSDDVIRYIVYTSPDSCGGAANNYLFESGEQYLFQDANVFIFSGGGVEINEVLITYTDASTQLITINSVSESKYAPYKLIFINKFGALQDLWFFKRSNESITTSDNKYKGNILTNGSYNISTHQSKILNKQAKEKLTLNSGFVDEDMNELFKQLMLSEKVWILYGGQTLPVNISNSSLAYKTSLNDRLINYTIDCDLAFDTITSVR